MSAKAPRKPYVRWSEDVAERVCEQLAQGVPLRHLAAYPDLPSPQQIRAWMRTKPGFAARVDQARVVGGLPRRGRPSRFDPAIADAVVERLAQGAPLYVIAQDPALPCLMTLYNWMNRRPDFARDVIFARDAHLDAVGAHGWALAQAATPDTAREIERLLGGLRARANAFAPRKAWG